jgi:prepilin-type processing-associated H-X9-DG protein
MDDPLDKFVAACASLRDGSGAISYTGLSWFVSGAIHTNYNHLIEPNGPIVDCGLSGVYTPPGPCTARSNHPGGVNAAMADGSARFFSQSLNRQVWRALGTRAGGEAVSDDMY